MKITSITPYIFKSAAAEYFFGTCNQNRHTLRQSSLSIRTFTYRKGNFKHNYRHFSFFFCLILVSDLSTKSSLTLQSTSLLPSLVDPFTNKCHYEAQPHTHCLKSGNRNTFISHLCSWQQHFQRNRSQTKHTNTY